MEEIKNERIWAMSCYFPLINIITCVLASVKMVNSANCLFHARQGLVLFALWFLSVIAVILSPFLSLVMWVLVLLLHVGAIAMVFAGNPLRIPVLSQLALKIPEKYLYTLLTGKIP